MPHNGHLAEALKLTERALSLTDDSETRARLLRTRSVIFAAMGATDLDREAAHDAVVAARAGGDRVLHAEAVVNGLASANNVRELDELRAEYAALREHLSEREAKVRWLDEEAANILAGQYRNLDPDVAEEHARLFAFASITEGSSGPHPLRLARVLFDTGRVQEGWEVLQPIQQTGAFQGSRVWELLGARELARGHLLRGETDSARELATNTLAEQILLGVDTSVVAALLAQLGRRTGDLGAALAVLDRAVAHTRSPIESPAASLLWRRALVHHALGNPTSAQADLDAALPVLAGLPLDLLELLGCLATEALVTTDPTRAATLLGCVDAHRRSWVLPQDIDDDLAPLRAQFATTHPDALAAGRPLAPHLAATSTSVALERLVVKERRQVAQHQDRPG